MSFTKRKQRTPEVRGIQCLSEVDLAHGKAKISAMEGTDVNV